MFSIYYIGINNNILCKGKLFSRLKINANIPGNNLIIV